MKVTNQLPDSSLRNGRNRGLYNEHRLARPLNPMRTFFQTLLVLAASTSCWGQSNALVGGTGTEGRSNPQDGYFNWSAREVIQPTTLAADKVGGSSIGDVVSILFDGAKVDLQGPGQPLAATWLGSIRIPISQTRSKSPASYKQDLRAFVSKTPAASVTIVLDLGSKTHIIHYPYGTRIDGNISREFFSPTKSAQGRFYTGTVLIFAERKDSSAPVMVNIDSIEVQVRPALRQRK